MGLSDIIEIRLRLCVFDLKSALSFVLVWTDDRDGDGECGVGSLGR